MLKVDGYYLCMSDEAACLAQESVAFIKAHGLGKFAPHPVSVGRIESMKRLKDAGFYTGRVMTVVGYMQRIFLRCFRGEQPLWLDATTGTFFESDGHCVTSENLKLMGEPEPISKAQAKKYFANLHGEFEDD